VTIRNFISRLPAVAATAVALVLVLVADNGSASVGTPSVPLPAPGLVKIVSPGQGTLVRGSVRVVVRLAPGARHFDVRVRAADVTRHFSRHGSLMVGVLSSSGRLLRQGVNHIFVTARDRTGRFGSAVRRIVLGRHVPSFLTVSLARRSSLEAPVPIRVRTRWARTIFRATLNGHPIRRALSHGRHGWRRGVLAADDGLHFGRNRLTVVAYANSGTYDTETRTFRVRRDRPLVGAGRDTRIVTHEFVRLDGRATKPMRPGDRLSFSWRIVSSPAGSHPSLRSASSRRPVLQTDTPGEYDVRLTVSETRGGKSHSARIAAANATDDVGVSADVYLPPVGAQVNTLISSGGTTGVQVNGAMVAADTPGQIEEVVLDRTDPANPVVFKTPFQGTSAEIQTAIGGLKLNGFDSPDYEIVLSGAPAQGLTLVQSSALSEFNDLLAEIGASPVSGGQLAQLENGFSVVGYSGLQAGAAAENFGNQLGPPVLYGQTPPGDLAGYFTQDSAGNYDFNFTDYQPFDTDTAGNNPAAGQVTMEVHGVQYSFPNVAQGKGAFAVLQCSATALTCTPSLFPIDGFSASTDAGLQQTFATYLQQLPPNTLILIQSDGAALFPDTTSWAAIASAIQNLGGTADLVNRMQVGSSYALVGGNALQGPGLETQTATTNSGTGTLTGVLSRNTSAAYQPYLEDPTGSGIDFSLLNIAYQQSTQFPNWRTSGRLAADNYIATHSNPQFCAPSLQDCTNATVEQYYWQNINTGNWESDGAHQVNQVNCPTSGTSLSGVPFTQADCEADIAEWESGQNGNGNEFALVDEVNTFITNLKTPFQGSSEFKVYVDLSTIAGKIQSAVNPGSSQALASAYSIIQETFHLLSEALAPVSEEFASPTGVVAAGIGLGTALSAEQDGTLDAQAVQDKANELAGDLVDRIQNTENNLGQLYNVIVSDYGKLETVGNNASNIWAWNSGDQTDATNGLTLGADGTFYQKLMPAAYHMWDFGSSTGGSYTCGKGGENGIQTPFPHMPSSDYFGFITGFKTGSDGQPSPLLDYRGMAQWSFNSEPPSSLTGPMFEPYSTTNGSVGLNPEWFLSQNFTNSGSYTC
jgi:hypothetical protein